MDKFKTMEGERIEQLERDKVALIAEIQDLRRENNRLEQYIEDERLQSMDDMCRCNQ